MCGIAGILDLRRRSVDQALLVTLCDALKHRGPDAAGYYTAPSVALGHRRLSIIDLAGGQQPMPNEDGSIWATFNGEIYNFRDLRRTLEQAGHHFQTDSDTEVIVHAYEEYGARCVTYFRGMFAFALWDERRQQLLLARDRVGKKPIFYAEIDGQFIFASELTALLRHPSIRPVPDPTAIDDYLTYGYIPAPKSILQNVRKLAPAHLLAISVAASDRNHYESSLERYWQLEYAPKLVIREEEAAEALLEVLTQAVRLRQISDVPLGALLSGGLDSSMIVALMSQQASTPVKTFSIGFDEQEFDELPFARMVAQRYGTEHHELLVRPTALEVLPLLVRHYGEPFADSSAVPSYYVAQMTRQHVKVALNGDGGDECFAGYDRYLGSELAEKYRLVPAVLRHRVIEPVTAWLPESLPARNRLRQAKNFVRVAGQPLAQRYLRWVTYFSSAQKEALYTADFRSAIGQHNGADWLLSQLAARHGTDSLDTLLAVDVQSYLPYDLLVKMDIATMANSLEARSPFLDHEVMEFCARLPSNFKIRGVSTKYLLKQIAKRFLPQAALRRRKMGFGVPIGDWMRNDLRPLLEDVLLSPRAAQRGYFQPTVVRQLAQDHISGKHDYRFQLWALLWLELWHREFVDQEVR